MQQHEQCLNVRAALMGLALLGTAAPGPALAEAVLAWNVTGFAATEAGGQNNPRISRSLAMLHLAIHDALNALDRRYEPYLYMPRQSFPPGLEGASDRAIAADAAVASAARDVLVSVLAEGGTAEQRGKARDIVEKAYAESTAKLPDGAPRRHGIGVGQAAAAALITQRQADGANLASEYTPSLAAGRWRPHPNPVPPDPPVADPRLAAGFWPAMLPHWGRVAPFMLLAPWQFRLGGPPELAGADYARDYEEVKRLGGKLSSERNAEQSEIARYWYEGSPQSWSRIGRVLAAERALDRWEAARLLALLNAAIADGFIAGFDTRYVYDFWRPVTAIRAGDADGNDATLAEPGWESFLNTPPIPDYPSTHSIAGGAAATVLMHLFGNDQIAFAMTSGPPFAGITRTFTHFSAAAQENALSRIYAGIHFRSACRDGVALGKDIGRRAVAQHLQPYRP
jgi:hypothetical protein